MKERTAYNAVTDEFHKAGIFWRNLVREYRAYSEILNTQHQFVVSLDYKTDFAIPAKYFENYYYACICEGMDYLAGKPERRIVNQELFDVILPLLSIPKFRRPACGIERIDLVWPSPYHPPILSKSNHEKPYFIAGLLVDSETPPGPRDINKLLSDKGTLLRHAYYGFLDCETVRKRRGISFTLTPVKP